MIDAPLAVVFAFLADLENHCALAGPRLEIVGLDVRRGARDGGVIRIRGPLGLQRTATTRLLATMPPQEIVGRAQIGRHTTAQVRWVLEPREDATAVRLSAAVERAGILDRLLLALGARRWLRRAFTSAVGRLSDHFTSNPAQGLRATGEDHRQPTAAVKHPSEE